MKSRKPKFHFQIGEIISTFGRNIEIIDNEIRIKEKTNHGKKYKAQVRFVKYRCLDCGNIDWAIETNIMGKTGCNACCVPPKKLLVGVNDISTTSPWMVKYFTNGIEDAQKYMSFSREMADFTCPDCGRKYNKQISTVRSAGILACICHDGISYPNKYMYSLLEQLKISFCSEKYFEWSNNRRYDFYVENNSKKIIIEMNGSQHYINSFTISEKCKSLDEEILNDIYKKDIAIKNGIDYYFSINCCESSNEYIRNSIVNSGLFKALNISEKDVDWNLCNEFATSNFIKTVCEFKATHSDLTTQDIAKKYKIDRGTVVKYLKRGSEFGWCEYDSNESREILKKQGRIVYTGTPIYCLTNDSYYRSPNLVAKDFCSKNLQISPSSVRNSCKNDKACLGYKFTYITREEFNIAKERYPDKTVGNKFVL